jgi:aspartokinase-like uncharacterized kinase
MASRVEVPTVVKVGGSLLDLPLLGKRLRTWLGMQVRPPMLLVPGGGSTADAIRTLDRRHGLGEEAAHWLALRALSLNAAVLQALLPASQVIDDWHDAAALCRRGVVPILDAFHFACVDEECAGHLPHCWDVTSDSLAARVAVIAQARELILLKSVTIPESMCWAKAAQCGYVDPMFAQTCAQGGGRLTVRAVNFRYEFSPNGA